MPDIDEIRRAFAQGRLEWTNHASDSLDHEGLWRECILDAWPTLEMVSVNDEDARGTEYLVRGRWQNIGFMLDLTWMADDHVRIITVYVPKVKRRGRNK